VNTDELIAALRAADPEGTARVLVAGYETDLDEVDIVSTDRVRAKRDPYIYEGAFRTTSSRAHGQRALVLASSRRG
jgi:hypothetical protein